MRGLPLWPILAGMLLALPGTAETVHWLYTEQVAVRDQSAGSRAAASGEALRAVLVRVSGERELPDDPALQRALRNADALIDQYRYDRLDPADGDGAWRLELQFNASGVNDLLRASGLPLWPVNRPATLVWLLVDDGEQQQFAHPDTTPELVAALRARARERGLPLRFPLLDLRDNLAVAPHDLWQLRLEVVEQAALRYGEDALLTGRLSRLSSGRWVGTWYYLFGGERIGFEGEGEDYASYVGPALERIADLLAARFAIAPEAVAAAGVLLELQGVDGFTQFATALDYLEGLAAVRSAQPVEVTRELLRVHLQIDGTLEQLRNVLALERRLQPATGGAGWSGADSGSGLATLQYRWQTGRAVTGE